MSEVDLTPSLTLTLTLILTPLNVTLTLLRPSAKKILNSMPVTLLHLTAFGEVPWPCLKLAVGSCLSCLLYCLVLVSPWSCPVLVCCLLCCVVICYVGLRCVILCLCYDVVSCLVSSCLIFSSLA
jgi:hypothetical protein